MTNTEDQFTKEEHSNLKTILIIEDEAAIGDLLVEAILEETPHRAVLAADGPRAFHIIEHIKPSLFLLDFHLPQMNGIEVYDRLHATNGLEHIPAILMTAGVLQHDIRRRKIVGISKPVDLNKLLDLI